MGLFGSRPKLDFAISETIPLRVKMEKWNLDKRKAAEYEFRLCDRAIDCLDGERAALNETIRVHPNN